MANSLDNFLQFERSSTSVVCVLIIILTFLYLLAVLDSFDYFVNLLPYDFLGDVYSELYIGVCSLNLLEFLPLSHFRFIFLGLGVGVILSCGGMTHSICIDFSEGVGMREEFRGRWVDWRDLEWGR